MHQSETLLDLMTVWTIGRESPFNPGAQAQPIEYLNKIIADGITEAQSAYISRGRLSSLILQQCGNMRPLYNDTGVFQTFATAWFQSRSEQFDHLLKSLFTEYDPFQEFNWHEHEVLNGRLKTDDRRNVSDNATITNNGGFSNTGSSDEVTETGVSADNESAYQNREKVTRGVDDTLTNTHNDTTGTTETKADTFDGLRKTDDVTDRDFYGHKLSNQQLSLQELEVAQNNLYDIIVKWFTDALFIGVYT